MGNFYTFNFEVKRQTGTKTTTAEYKQSLLLVSFTFGKVTAFTEALKRAVKAVIKAKKDYDENYNGYLTINGEITALYDEDNKKGFDRWVLRGIDDICTEKGEESIYMIPDERYTEPQHDVLLMARNPIEGLDI